MIVPQIPERLKRGMQVSVGSRSEGIIDSSELNREIEILVLILRVVLAAVIRLDPSLETAFQIGSTSNDFSKFG